MLEVGTQLQGRYIIEEQIGQGGMGAVYLAVDQKFSISNRVAIKETFYESPELAEAFEREARLLNSLHHPILPHVSDYFTEGGGNFLVMEYIEGEDLSAILKRDGAFPLNDVMRWTQEILDGLDYLHSQEPPIIHRDIKPNNLKLTSRGFIVLLDFGLAKENEDVTLGERSVFGYSRRYSPLEQIEGVGTDARSDIFSLGATVYHLLTGRPPADALARASAIVAAQPDPLQLANEINSEIPEPLARVLHSALALNADQRFASAKAMSSALEYAINPEAAAAKNAGADVTPAVEQNISSLVDVVAFPALQAFKAEIEQNAPDFVHEDAETAISESPATADPTPRSPVVLPVEQHDDTAVLDEPLETTPVHDLGPVDAAPTFALDTVEETAAGDAEPPEETVVTAPPMRERRSFNTQGPELQKGAVWLSLILVALLAIVYGISRSGSDAAAESVTGTDAAVANSAEQSPADTASSPVANSAPPASDGPEIQEAELAAEPDSFSAKPASKPSLPVLRTSPEKPTESVSRSSAKAPTRETAPAQARAQAPARNQASAQRPPVQQARRNNTPMERGEPVSSIEEVFTGTNWRDERRNRRLRRWEVRTWDSEEEYRREQRRIRRMRQQNGWPF